MSRPDTEGGDMIFLLFSISGHWELLHESYYCSFWGIDFVDTLNGWVCGDYGMVWRTRDGGVSWETLYVTKNVVLYDICFLDTLTGWVCGDYGYIAKTTDGGYTWEKQNSGVLGRLYSIEFQDHRNGWCSGVNGVLRTVDGGNYWDETSLKNLEVRSISSLNKNIVWAQVWENNKFYVSYDGGIRWKEKVLPEGVVGYRLFAIDTLHIKVIADYYPSARLYYSNDGGNSFEKSDDYIDGLFFLHDGSIYFVDALFGWIGSSFTLHLTVDGGKTLYKVYTPGNDWVIDIVGIDRNHFWGVSWYPEFYSYYRCGEIKRWVCDASWIEEKEEIMTFFLISKIKLEKDFKIYNLSGQLVRKLNEEIWDGKDEKGNVLRPGIYFGLKDNKKIKIIKLGGNL